MRKRVTFVEHLKNENLLQDGSGHILMRSSESNQRYVDGQQLRKMSRGGHLNVPTGSQHLRTIHIPKSVMSAPFLQHPGLTAGQRRYLYSIANVYSTEHMRRQMKQHYLNVLHTCLQSGQKSTCRWRHQHGEKSSLAEDAGKDVHARTKPQGQRKGNGGNGGGGSGVAQSDVIFPKIVTRRGM